MSERHAEQWYFEVHTRDGQAGPLYWQRQPGVYRDFLAAQTAAIINNRRPYRISKEPAQRSQPA